MSTIAIELTKHFGTNTAGEICGFSPKAAEHILSKQGGVKLAEYDEATHRFDVATKKAVPKTEEKKK
jgi:hypothetical protein